MHSRLDLGFARGHRGMMEEVILSTATQRWDWRKKGDGGGLIAHYVVLRVIGYRQVTCDKKASIQQKVQLLVFLSFYEMQSTCSPDMIVRIPTQGS